MKLNRMDNLKFRLEKKKISGSPGDWKDANGWCKNQWAVATYGVETIDILSQIPIEMMTNLLGKNGIELWRRSNGIDETPIVPYHEQKSIGTENTFERDTNWYKFSS